jgi:hypothetical protein
MGMLPNVFNDAVVAYVSLKRFDRFLNSSDVQPNECEDELLPSSNDPQGVDVLIKSAAFYWDTEKNKSAISLKKEANTG